MSLYRLRSLVQVRTGGDIFTTTLQPTSNFGNQTEVRCRGSHEGLPPVPTGGAAFGRVRRETPLVVTCTALCQLTRELHWVVICLFDHLLDCLAGIQLKHRLLHQRVHLKQRVHQRVYYINVYIIYLLTLTCLLVCIQYADV